MERSFSACYEDLADEVIVVGEDWPDTFSWPYIGQTFQKGLEKSTGDWAIRMDLDYFFHEKDFEYIRKFLTKKDKYPVVVFKDNFSHQIDIKFNLGFVLL